VPFKALQNVTPADIRSFASAVLARAGIATRFICPAAMAGRTVVETLEAETGTPAIAYTHASSSFAFKASASRI